MAKANRLVCKRCGHFLMRAECTDCTLGARAVLRYELHCAKCNFDNEICVVLRGPDIPSAKKVLTPRTK